MSAAVHQYWFWSTGAGITKPNLQSQFRLVIVSAIGVLNAKTYWPYLLHIDLDSMESYP